jgi:hypothetical protein
MQGRQLIFPTANAIEPLQSVPCIASAAPFRVVLVHGQSFAIRGIGDGGRRRRKYEQVSLTWRAFPALAQIEETVQYSGSV